LVFNIKATFKLVIRAPFEKIKNPPLFINQKPGLFKMFLCFARMEKNIDCHNE
jgi:hypothetical protein